jgi:hypothetical protein
MWMEETATRRGCGYLASSHLSAQFRYAENEKCLSAASRHSKSAINSSSPRRRRMTCTRYIAYFGESRTCDFRSSLFVGLINSQLELFWPLIARLSRHDGTSRVLFSHWRDSNQSFRRRGKPRIGDRNELYEYSTDLPRRTIGQKLTKPAISLSLSLGLKIHVCSILHTIFRSE